MIAIIGFIVGILMMCVFFYDIMAEKTITRNRTEQNILILILIIGFVIADISMIVLSRGLNV